MKNVVPYLSRVPLFIFWLAGCSFSFKGKFYRFPRLLILLIFASNTFLTAGSNRCFKYNFQMRCDVHGTKFFARRKSEGSNYPKASLHVVRPLALVWVSLTEIKVLQWSQSIQVGPWPSSPLCNPSGKELHIIFAQLLRFDVGGIYS